MLNFHIYPSNTMGKDQARDAQVLAQQSSAENQRLREEMHRINMIVEAMWNLLRAKTGLSDDDLRKQITEVEFEKAKAYTSTNIKCKNCSRPISVKSKTCVFCGEKTDNKEIFPL